MPSFPFALDLAPLQWSPSRTDLRAYRAWEQAQPADTLFRWSRNRAVRIVFGTLIGFALYASAVVTISERTGGLEQHLVLVVIALTIGVLAVIGVMIWQRVSATQRLQRFARAKAMADSHGLVFEPRPRRPHLTGSLFAKGKKSLVWPVVRDPHGRFEMGTVQYLESGGEDTRVAVEWGYLRFSLPRPLPHMLLDARRNGRRLPLIPARAQRLDLEGNFPDHFTLFVPTGYERDALYLFTPDLMVLLIDEAGDLDLEIIDDQLFVYAPHGIDLASPGLWERASRLATIIAAKTAERSAQWRDERLEMHAAAGMPVVPGMRTPAAFGAVVAPPVPSTPIGVAWQGSRLVRHLNWRTFTIAGALVVAWGVWEFIQSRP